MRKRLAAAVLLLALVASGCGAGGGAVDAGGIPVELDNYTIKPETLTLKAGETVILRVRNKSSVEHDFLIGHGPDAAVGTFAEDFFKGVEVKSTGGQAGKAPNGTFRLIIPPLSSAALSFTVPTTPGRWETGCFAAGHYALGMKGTLVVQ